MRFVDLALQLGKLQVDAEGFDFTRGRFAPYQDGALSIVPLTRQSDRLLV